MRIDLPQHRLSLDPSTDWVADEMDPQALASFGLYLRSVEHGVFLNVRSQESGGHSLTKDGLLGLLREQNWASPPFDEWTSAPGDLIVAGGTFETTDMGGEVVLEIFVTDGRSLANLAGPGERAVIAALTPSGTTIGRYAAFRVTARSDAAAIRGCRGAFVTSASVSRTDCS